MLRVRLSRLFWIGAAALLGAAALISIVAVLRGEFSETDGKILGTLGTLSLAGSAALAGLALVERRTISGFGWALAASSPVWFALPTVAIWGFESDTLAKWAVTSYLALGAELIVASNILLLRGKRLAPLVVITALLTLAATLLSVGAIWSEEGSEDLGKAIAVFWILAGLGYFLTPVLQRFAATAATTRPGRTLDVVRGAELVAVPAAEAGEDAMVRSEGGRLTVRVAGREVELGEDEVLLVRPRQARPGPG